MISQVEINLGGMAYALLVHAFFNRTEPRDETVWLISLFGLPLALATGVQLFNDLAFSFISLLQTQFVFLVTLVSSVVLYRLSPFHPLSRYPGPLFLRISRFCSFSILFSGKQHEYYRQLHEAYGPYIRTGPNHLHISDGTAIPSILGSRRFLKSERYDAVALKGWDPDAKTILGLVEPKDHSRRRRMWDRGLNTAALKDYQTLLFDRIDQLVSALRRESTPKTRHVDLARWVAFFTLDFMGDLAWGGVFNSMKEGVDTHGIIDLSRFITRVHETAGTIPWMKQVFKHLPVSKQTEQHSNFAKSIILERMNRGPTQTSDLFGNLIGESDTSSEPLSLTTLVHETSLALIAGTDTSAVTLANVFFYLLSYPDSLRRLQAELELASSTSAGKGTNYLAGLHYLNAVINETMRLQPVVPNGVQRVLIPGPSGQGEVVNDRYIPPRTNLQISTHCVHRDSENFSPHPDGFWPDRWLPDIQATLQEAERESFRLNEQAFFPFSYGPTGCAGKALALMEMRAVISAVLTNFDLAFADGWDPSEWECSLKDFYTMRGGPLKVVLTPRQKS